MKPIARIDPRRDLRWAVLSGDLIGSSQLTGTEIDLAFAILNDAARQMSRLNGDPRTTGLARRGVARNRGDGWQMLLDRPGMAMRAALYVRARMLSVSPAIRTRISMATGQVDLLPRNLNEARGPAFVASGHGLDGMPANATMTHADGGAVAAAARLCDHISSGWTRAQARAVHLALWPVGQSRSAIASQIGISRQAVDQALASAGIPAILDALAAIEAAEA